MFRKISRKKIDLLLEQIKIAKNERFYLQERCKYYRKKLNIKCPHSPEVVSGNPDITKPGYSLKGDYHYKCIECGREWDRTNFLSE